MPRKSVENNFAELLCALLVIGLKAVSLEEIQIFTEEKIKEGSFVCKDYLPWYEDLKQRSPLVIKKYVDNFNKQPKPWLIIKQVILTGKYDKDYPEIVDLNKGLNIKDKKSDIYIYGILNEQSIKKIFLNKLFD